MTDPAARPGISGTSAGTPRAPQDQDLTEDLTPATLTGTSAKPGEPVDPKSKSGAEVLKRKKGTKPLNRLRHTLTVIVIVAIFLLALILMLLVAFNKEPETQAALREVGTLILPPMLTLAGTSFAWFFAKKGKDEGD